MKTVKTIFAILFLSTMFIACEADAVNDEVGIEVNDQIGEDGDEEIDPTAGTVRASEDGDEDIDPTPTTTPSNSTK
ncbi:hypothetical protein [Aquimarina megaterium]|uniref:hypothetical protein n=1 Tax=Aquimarina megaterium TaxID=1443666 RepID=UPI00094384CD|nr:hypothetical protein [Aquimarina megaterium]